MLVGLTMTLCAAVYYLLPLLTTQAELYSQKLATCTSGPPGRGIGMGAFMGMAGLQGMLRRTIYYNGEFQPYMVLAAISGFLLLVALLVFLYNIVMTLGLHGAVGLFRRSALPPSVLVPGTDLATEPAPVVQQT